MLTVRAGVPARAGLNAFAGKIAMTNRLLSVTNLSVSFGNREVIHDLGFEVQEGDCVAIIGPNGAGKTVLLKALLRLIPYRGEIRWSAGARLGYVPQKIAADRQLPLSAKDLLAAKARFLNLPATELQEVSSELSLTTELLSTGIGALSGGQLLHSLQNDRGMTILLVSHDLSIVYRNANMVLCLSKGKTCMGPPKEILTPAMLQELYASPPQYYQHVHERWREGDSGIAQEREKR
ncbi:MAG: hypothetical protein DMG31_02210 [Acidobacteria bacterium]|nr:MAG: hypothetical protein DMG31_02210 [Acidobacteriota bacterium]